MHIDLNYKCKKTGTYILLLHCTHLGDDVEREMPVGISQRKTRKLFHHKAILEELDNRSLYNHLLHKKGGEKE